MRLHGGRVVMPDISREIVKHLPYLRRYARAITGDQVRGDSYVRAALEALLEEPERISHGENVRLQLYRLFHDVWVTVDVTAPEDEVVPGGEGTGRRLRDRLGALPARERQALLLASLEGFAVSDVARILRVTEDEAAGLVEQARADLRRQATTSVLIIEDEPVIAFHIADIVRESGHKVIGIAATRDEAVELAGKSRPGLVLADIQLDDGSTGIEAVHDILGAMDVPVIFVTAFPERLLTGEKVEPTYLVTKPFEPDTLKVTMAQALLFHPAAMAPSAGA